MNLLSHLLPGSCVWSLLSVYLYHFPLLKTQTPPSHTTRLVLCGATCSFLHCSLTLLSSSLFLLWPYLPLGQHIVVFSASYFIYDTCHQVYHEPQTIYLLHHLTCIVVWSVIMTYNIGYTLSCEFLWLAELTNLTRIPWEVSTRLGWYDWNKRLHLLNQRTYEVTRCLFLPLYLWFRTRDILSLSLPGNLARIVWMVVLGFVAVGVYWRPNPTLDIPVRRNRVSPLV